MRHVRLVMCDPANADQTTSLQKVVDAHLAKHSEAKLTWLQSAATKSVWLQAQQRFINKEHHLLTCVIEFEGTIGALQVPAKPTKRR